MLDDNDQLVKEQVEQELIQLGDDLVNRLQEAAETVEDKSIQASIDEFIERIQLQHFTEQLLQWRKGGGKDLFEGWLLVSQINRPELDVNKYRTAVSRIVNTTWLKLSTGMSDLEKLCVINKQLFSLDGFVGNFQNQSDPANNFLDEVLDRKTGNTLSLSTLYAIVAAKLDIPLQVVNFNGYFALRYYSKHAHFYIDPHNGGIFFTTQQVQRFLQKEGFETNLLTYKPLSNIYVILALIQAATPQLEEHNQFEDAERFKKVLQDIEIRLDGLDS
jgi:regulator of sirC expression with transglutaminase-like and TPR domain